MKNGPIHGPGVSVTEEEAAKARRPRVLKRVWTHANGTVELRNRNSLLLIHSMSSSLGSKRGRFFLLAEGVCRRAWPCVRAEQGACGARVYR